MRNFTLFCVLMTSKLVFSFLCPDNCLICDSSKSCTSCKDGYWGNICELPCSRCQQGTSCEKTNGFCLEKCKDGYTGILCDAFCKDKCLKCDRMNAGLCYLCALGRYGESCDKHCSEFCYNNTCNDNGYCICISGYWGPKCENNCSSNCKNISCNYQTGACTYGCTGTFTGNRCDSASRQERVNFIVIVVLIVVLIVGILAVCFIVRKISQRRRTRQDKAEAPAEIPLLKTKMKTSEDSGVCSKKSSPTSRTHETDVLIQKLPAGQEGSLEFYYVSGFLGDNTYLVCQAPTAETGESFWEMVWQRNCNVIVNLSSSVELTERKQVIQMQFSHWPADGFPKSLPKLLAFHQKLEEFKTKITGHLLVYCSGDQSRSYTYIALDKAMNELEREDNGDITVEQYLHRLRAEGLISSDEQYAFLRRIIDLWRAPWSTQADSKGESQYPKDREENVSFQETEDCTKKSRGDTGKKQQFFSSAQEAEAHSQHKTAGSKGSLELRYVSGFCGDSTYLVWQDPAAEQEEAFWKMVFQKNCNAIVNLSGSVEDTEEHGMLFKAKEKQTYGSLSVTFMGGIDFDGYEERRYELEKLTERKQVTQMQFLNWPENGLPENLPKLFDFRRKLKEVRTELTGPLLVHCSGGQSRSYTFIALDKALNELEREDNADTPAEQYLNRLRADGLISSDEQYAFLQTTTNFWRATRHLQIKEEAVSNQDICTSLVIDSPRAFLECRHVCGLSGAKAYLICKDPTKKDAADFWETVWQQNCYVIVTLRTMTEMTLKNTYRYWPYDNRTKTFGFISVTTTEVQTTNYFIRRTLEIKKLNDRRRVTQLQFPLWLPDSFPKNERELLEFRQKVQELSKDLSGPLLVHCSDGKSRSGLYTALDIVLTDLETQDHVDMPLDHYLEKLRAAHLISTDDEIEFLSNTIQSWKSSREAQNSS